MDDFHQIKNKSSALLLSAVKKRFWKKRKFWIWILVIIAVALAAFLFGKYNFYADSFVGRYEKLMEDDVRGGRTPAETLKLFAGALRAGDVESAAEYFMLDDEGGRKFWVEALQKAKDEGRLDQIAEQVERAKPNPSDSTSAVDFKYIITDGAGAVEATINLELNSYSKVWKIESL